MDQTSTPHPDTDRTERSVQSYYNKYGWVEQADGARGEDVRFRDRSRAHSDYELSADARLQQLLEGYSGSLLIGGAGDMPAGHQQIARGFESLHLLDISEKALDVARSKLGAGPEYLHGSLLAIPLPDNAVNAALAAHVLYHIDGSRQATAVREIIRVLKPGGRAIVPYFNPRSVFYFSARMARRMFPLKKPLGFDADPTVPPLYFKAFKLGWWDQFKDSCEVSLKPGLITGGADARAILRSEPLARAFFGFAERFERQAPAIAVRVWSYPFVVLDRTTH